jgi:hypothetical protein
MRDILSVFAAAIVAVAIGSAPFGNAVAADDKKTERQKDQASAEYKEAEKRADAEYKAASARCKEMKGNEKDVCMKEAKAAQKKAKADAKAQRSSSSARAEAGDERRKADYNTAKEKCDSLSGKAKDTCVKDAKKKYHQD